MSLSIRTRLTLICEAALEHRVLKDLERLGVTGWTLSEVRGKGTRGVRSAEWGNDSNIRLEVICARDRAEQIVEHLHQHYYDNYAMICYLSEVEVLRPQKF